LRYNSGGILDGIASQNHADKWIDYSGLYSKEEMWNKIDEITECADTFVNFGKYIINSTTEYEHLFNRYSLSKDDSISVCKFMLGPMYQDEPNEKFKQAKCEVDLSKKTEASGRLLFSTVGLRAVIREEGDIVTYSELYYSEKS